MVGDLIHIRPEEVEQFDVVTAGPQETADYRVQLKSLPFASDEFDWVIVNDPGLNLDVEEYRRVIKPTGKITIQFNPLFSRQ